MTEFFSDTDQDSPDQDDARCLASAVTLLGERRYQIALLHFGHHMTQQAIARRLRISQPKVSRELAEIERLRAQHAGHKRPSCN